MTNHSTISLKDASTYVLHSTSSVTNGYPPLLSQTLLLSKPERRDNLVYKHLYQVTPNFKHTHTHIHTYKEHHVGRHF